MCGIVGRLNYLSDAPVDPGALRSMARLIAHRGPDGEGVWSEGAIGLAHRRLAIIDLSQAAAQPMVAANGHAAIVFNGEIYNFQEIRRELEGRGVRFRSRSDTEVILAAYQEWGIECLSRLRGMFAFGIWDGPRRRLLLVRDRLGMKPLWYRIDSNGIAFASEAKAFLGEPAYAPEVDPAGISQYLTYQYVPAPASAFRGVTKLPPAHYLLLEDGTLTVHRYWRLQYGPKRRIREAAAADELLTRLREAVRLRLVSDVPLGAFLSGGLDSSAIVALMAQETNRPVQTFSIGFDEAEYNELPYARMVAQRYETDHREFVVRPDAIGLLPKIVWHYGEPFADSSAIPTYYLAEQTRQHVTVALNGDGGDESFAGYERYLAHVAATRVDRLPRPVRRLIASLAPLLPWHSPKWARGRQLLEAQTESAERRYAYGLMHFQPSLKAKLCTPEFVAEAGDGDATEIILDAYSKSHAENFLDRTLDVDVSYYLPDDLLVKVDVASMAHGLEARSPLLDHTFMEFAASLPPDLKLRGLVKKYIFKRALRGLLPDALIDRRKMGFGVPIDHWFRGDLGVFASDVLLSRVSIERGYFNTVFVRRLLDEHRAGVRSWHYQLWNLLVLELWHRAFIDSRPRVASDAVATLAR